MPPAQRGRKPTTTGFTGGQRAWTRGGTVIAQGRDGVGHALAEIDLAHLDSFRTEFPDLANRRPKAHD